MKDTGVFSPFLASIAIALACTAAVARPDAPRARRPAQHAPAAITDNRFGWFGNHRVGVPSRYPDHRNDWRVYGAPGRYPLRYDRWPVSGYDTCWYTRSWYGRYRWDSGRWYDSPTTRYHLVEIDPSRAATQSRSLPGSSAFHDWQRSMLSRPEAEHHARSDAAPAQAVAPPSPSTPTASLTPPARTDSDPWGALGRGDWLAARDAFASRADDADPRAAALASFGSAVTLTMLGREDAAAWALRRAIDKDANVVSLVPAEDAVRARVRAAAERARAIATERPHADHLFLADTLEKAAAPAD